MNLRILVRNGERVLQQQIKAGLLPLWQDIPTFREENACHNNAPINMTEKKPEPSNIFKDAYEAIIKERYYKEKVEPKKPKCDHECEICFPKHSESASECQKEVNTQCNGDYDYHKKINDSKKVIKPREFYISKGSAYLVKTHEEQIHVTEVKKGHRLISRDDVVRVLSNSHDIEAIILICMELGFND